MFKFDNFCDVGLPASRMDYSSQEDEEAQLQHTPDTTHGMMEIQPRRREDPQPSQVCTRVVRQGLLIC